ncbi:hypothetical protein C8F01DRAFT_1077835 [Mycena amicta]|nr:hypothetical protein C8F01DRAFT_1077835 [Mycena amicta]
MKLGTAFAFIALTLGTFARLATPPSNDDELASISELYHGLLRSVQIGVHCKHADDGVAMQAVREDKSNGAVGERRCRWVSMPFLAKILTIERKDRPRLEDDLISYGTTGSRVALGNGSDTVEGTLEVGSVSILQTLEVGRLNLAEGQLQKVSGDDDRGHTESLRTRARESMTATNVGAH